jgi:nucleoside-diphosphate-sugar epimerase
VHKRIIVTGASGFIGKTLVSSLRKQNIDVLCLDFLSGTDLTMSDSILQIDKNYNIVVHLAAKSYVPESFENPRSFYYNNLVSTMNLLEYCRLNGASMIFFSSYLYGNPDYLPIDENHPLKPHNPYAQTKLIGENLCRAYERDFDVPITILRPFNVYGIGQSNNFLIPTIIKQFQSNGIKTINLKDPRPKRDFIYIDDIISAVEQIIIKNLSGLNIFNIGYGKSHSIESVVKILQKLFPCEKPMHFTNEIRRNEVLDTVANIDNISEMLGWEPRIDIEEGLSLIVQNILSHEQA